jgi:hypothetical protein
MAGPAEERRRALAGPREEKELRLGWWAGSCWLMGYLNEAFVGGPLYEMWPASLDGSNSSRPTVHGLRDRTEIELWMCSYYFSKRHATARRLLGH